MDSAKARYASYIKQAQTGGFVAGLQAKIDAAKDEMDDATMKCEQMKDQLAAEMYSFAGKESDLDRLLFDLVQAQVSYHRRCLQVLDGLVPQLHECLEYNVMKPSFGQSLEEHLSSHNCELSTVIEECVSVLAEHGLEEEGLFRIAGAASKIKKLKAAFNSNTHQVIASMDDLDLHVVASVLKLYLRELPEPLMTFNLHNDFMHAVHKPAEQRLGAIKEVVSRLPKANYMNLRYLMKFLAKLAENSSVNKMSPSNIAVVMGPNLMWAQGDQGPNMLTTGIQSTIIEALIVNVENFFPGDVNFAAAAPRMSNISSYATVPNLHSTENNNNSTGGVLSHLPGLGYATAQVGQPSVAIPPSGYQANVGDHDPCF